MESTKMNTFTRILKFSKPYKDEFTVFVSVIIDNLKELSKLKLSKVKMLDNKKIDINSIKGTGLTSQSSREKLIHELKGLGIKNPDWRFTVGSG